MKTDLPGLPNDPQDAAAYWFARVRSGSFTLAEREQFQRWRQADARHEREYRALDEIWHAASLVPEAELRELLEAPESASERQRRSRRRWMLVGATSAAAIVAGVLGYDQLRDSSSQVLRFATAHGQRRRETLPDGSVIELNVATELVVLYSDRRRAVELIRGEAAFGVATEPGRPFLVDAGSVAARVTGTVFSVRREPKRVAVAVQSGAVEVSSGRWWDRQTAMLAAGMVAQAGEGLPLAVARADVAAITAWRQGKVVFKDQPLEDVVREMNRYLAQPIHLADSRLKRLQMAGVFSIDDADGFLQALQGQMPVVVVARPDGGVSLSLMR